MKIREPIREFLRVPLHLVELALLMVGFGQGPVVAVVLSRIYPTISSVALSVLLFAFAALLIVFIITPYPGSVRVGFNLVGESNDPRRTFLILDFVYSFLVQENLFLLYFVAFVWFIGGSSFNGWVLYSSTGVIFATFYYYLVMMAMGQQYESRRGISFLGVSAFAKIAEQQFREGRREGMFKLINAFSMMEYVFSHRMMEPTYLKRTYAAVEAASDMKNPPLNNLERLAKALTYLPDRSQLQTAFSEFILTLGWPLNFQLEDERRGGTNTRGRLLLAIIPSIVTALVSATVGNVELPHLVVVITTSYLSVAIGATALVVAWIVCFRALGYPTSIMEVRNRRSLR